MNVELIKGNIINLLSLAFPRLAAIQEWLSWSNATTLALSWGLPGVTDSTMVLLPVTGDQYHWMPALYLAAAVLLGMFVFTRRDVM